MIKKIIESIISAALLATASTMPGNLVQARPVDPSEVPTFVPQGSRGASRYNSEQPSNFSSATPWLEAINTSNQERIVEMSDWRMICETPNGTQVVASGLNNIGAGFYLQEPWYGNDQNTRLTPQRTSSGTIIFPVKPNRITHWFLDNRPTIRQGRNCTVTARVRMSEGVFVGAGADWWVNTTSGWCGQDVCNIYQGRSAWHNHEGGWQTIRF